MCILSGFQGGHIKTFLQEDVQVVKPEQPFVFPAEAETFATPLWSFVYHRPEADFPYAHSFRSYLPILLATGYDGLREPVEVRKDPAAGPDGADAVQIVKGVAGCLFNLCRNRLCCAACRLLSVTLCLPVCVLAQEAFALAWSSSWS